MSRCNSIKPDPPLVFSSQLGFEFYKRSLILPIAGSTYEISSVRTLPTLNLFKSRQDEDYGSILNFQNTSNIDAPTSPSSELRPLDRAIKRQWILESTRTPRPGLIAIRELYQQEYGGILNLDPIRNCFDEQSLFGFFANYDLCYAIMYNITEQAGILSDLGLSEFVDPSLLQASLGELNFMEDDIDVSVNEGSRSLVACERGDFPDILHTHVTFVLIDRLGTAIGSR